MSIQDIAKLFADGAWKCGRKELVLVRNANLSPFATKHAKKKQGRQVEVHFFTKWRLSFMLGPRSLDQVRSSRMKIRAGAGWLVTHKSTPILAWRSRLWRHKSPVHKIFNSRTPSWTKSSRLPWLKMSTMSDQTIPLQYQREIQVSSGTATSESEIFPLVTLKNLTKSF